MSAPVLNSSVNVVMIDDAMEGHAGMGVGSDAVKKSEGPCLKKNETKVMMTLKLTMIQRQMPEARKVVV